MREKLILLIIFFALAAVAAEIPGVITLYSYKKTQMQRSPVMFNHEKHMSGNMGCLDCHHFYKNGQQVMSYAAVHQGKNLKCKNCHQSGKNLRDRYHSLCQGCHREYKNYKIKTGPLECGLCHKK